MKCFIFSSNFCSFLEIILSENKHHIKKKKLNKSNEKVPGRGIIQIESNRKSTVKCKFLLKNLKRTIFTFSKSPSSKGISILKSNNKMQLNTELKLNLLR